MPDRLVIHDLKAECRIGVFDWERERPQPIWIDLELAIDAAKAARRDDVQAAVDYGHLVTSVKGLAEGKTYQLLETLAEDVAALVLEEFRVPQVRVQVKKRALPGINYAAVEVERLRRVTRTGAAGRSPRSGRRRASAHRSRGRPRRRWPGHRE